MKVVVDAVGNRAGGGGVVLLAVLEALLNEPRFTEIILCCSPRQPRGFDLPVSRKLRVSEQCRAHASLLVRLWWLEFGAARLARSLQADRMILLNGAGRAPDSCPVISFVQQAIPLMPESWRAVSWGVKLRMKVLRWAMKRGTQRATLVAVQRAGMRSLLVEQFGLASGRIEIFEPEAPSFPEAADPNRKLELMTDVPADRRILYVGSTEPHKNVRLAALAVARVRRLLPGASLFATCNPQADIESSAGVCWLGNLNRSEMRLAYERATVLLMPSKVESLGLPLLEAMALGIPILAANLTYAREVCRDAAIFFNPDSVEDAATKLEQLLLDCALRQRLRDMGLEVVKRRAQCNGYEALAQRLANIGRGS